MGIPIDTLKFRVVPFKIFHFGIGPLFMEAAVFVTGAIVRIHRYKFSDQRSFNAVIHKLTPAQQRKKINAFVIALAFSPLACNEKPLGIRNRIWSAGRLRDKFLYILFILNRNNP